MCIRDSTKDYFQKRPEIQAVSSQTQNLRTKLDFQKSLNAVALFQQQHQRWPRRNKRASKHEQTLANFVDKAKQRKDRSLGFLPSQRRLTITEAAQLTAVIDRHQQPVLQKLTLRGINIQYPFSRLILSGVKSVEARRYPLGHRNLAHKNEDLFLIETHGTGDLKGVLMESERELHKRRREARDSFLKEAEKARKKREWTSEKERERDAEAQEIFDRHLSERRREIAAQADKEYAQRCKREREMVCTRSLVESFGPPPSKGEAHVIGIVSFSESEQYHHRPRRYRCHRSVYAPGTHIMDDIYDKPRWSEDRSKHRIKEGGHHDWNGEEPMYAWYVGNVLPLSKPVPAGEYNKVRDQWGYRRPRTLDLVTSSFLDTGTEDDVRKQSDPDSVMENAPESWNCSCGKKDIPAMFSHCSACGKSKTTENVSQSMEDKDDEDLTEGEKV